MKCSEFFSHVCDKFKAEQYLFSPSVPFVMSGKHLPNDGISSKAWNNLPSLILFQIPQMISQQILPIIPFLKSSYHLPYLCTFPLLLPYFATSIAPIQTLLSFFLIRINNILMHFPFSGFFILPFENTVIGNCREDWWRYQAYIFFWGTQWLIETLSKFFSYTHFFSCIDCNTNDQ